MICVLVACGGTKTPTTSTPQKVTVATAADRILPILPDGAQVIVEVDLARLRANPAIGALVTTALAGELDLPAGVPVPPLAKADTLVMASYGVGTSSAATVLVLATKEPVANSVTLGEGLVALGPPEWTAQLEARAAIAGVREASSAPAIVAAKELLDLRDRAMPEKAPGASLRVTARLPFDARVALARATGIDTAPAQISIWGDVVDDLVIIVDVDAADPGDKKTKQPVKRMEAGLRGVLAGLADAPPVKLLGLAPSLEGAELVTRGTWLRAIIAVGPKRLGRAVERAKTFLATPPPAPQAVPSNAEAS